MKNLQDLMELTTKCLEQSISPSNSNEWFVSFSGHVNRLDISFYLGGWDLGNGKSKGEGADKCNVTLDEAGIQEAYWFIANRL